MMDYIAFMSGIAAAFIAHAVRKKRERPLEKLKQALLSFAISRETCLSKTYNELAVNPINSTHLHTEKECEIFFDTFIRNVAPKNNSQSYT
jgi:hypothetical protein